jgi:hypothetical protein
MKVGDLVLSSSNDDIVKDLTQYLFSSDIKDTQFKMDGHLNAITLFR